MAYPRFMRARAFKVLSYTGGNYTPTLTTTWAAVPASTELDLTLNAQVGDVIEWGGTARFSNGSDNIWLDVVSIVSGAAVAQWATGSALVNGTGAGAGIGSLFIGASAAITLPFSHGRAVTAADIANGQVTVRPYWRAHGSSSAATMFASTTGMPLYLYAKNLGPADPN